MATHLYGDKDYFGRTWFWFGAIPSGGAQGSLLAVCSWITFSHVENMLWGTGMEPRLAVCKVVALPTVLPLWPHRWFLKCSD